eukprot:scaffold56413_cov62-Phaeocystis_antarctica.AAC.4
MAPPLVSRHEFPPVSLARQLKPRPFRLPVDPRMGAPPRGAAAARSAHRAPRRVARARAPGARTVRPARAATLPRWTATAPRAAASVPRRAMSAGLPRWQGGRRAESDKDARAWEQEYCPLTRPPKERARGRPERLTFQRRPEVALRVHDERVDPGRPHVDLDKGELGGVALLEEVGHGQRVRGPPLAGHLSVLQEHERVEAGARPTLGEGVELRLGRAAGAARGRYAAGVSRGAKYFATTLHRLASAATTGALEILTGESRSAAAGESTLNSSVRVPPLITRRRTLELSVEVPPPLPSAVLQRTYCIDTHYGGMRREER